MTFSTRCPPLESFPFRSGGDYTQIRARGAQIWVALAFRGFDRLAVVEDVAGIPAAFDGLEAGVVVLVVEGLPVFEVGIGVVDVAAVGDIVGDGSLPVSA